jgi:hypothetical protein
MLAAMRRGAGDRPRGRAANKKEPEAVYALRVPELCLNLGF